MCDILQMMIETKRVCLARSNLFSLIFLCTVTSVMSSTAFAESPSVQTKSLNPLVELGRAAYFDTRLSEPAGVSCASCHDPALAFTGDNGSGLAVAAGAPPGSLGTRQSPTLMYLAKTPALDWATIDDEQVLVGGFFWDGRAGSFETQALGPLFSANEMNNTSVESLSKRLETADYASQFKALFGPTLFNRPDDAVTALATALGAFQRSPEFAPFSSKFDAVVRGEAELSETESRGLDYFTISQKGNCLSCHTVDIDSDKPQDSLFTNFGYHALGAPRNTELPETAKPDYYDLGLCETLRDDKRFDSPDQYCGFFKTPTLRNIALTAPYMHNGTFKTLREAVAFYATRDTQPQDWFPNAEKFNDLPVQMRGNVDTSKRPYHRKKGKRAALKDDEIDDIVAFLNTLTDGYQAPQAAKE